MNRGGLWNWRLWFLQSSWNREGMQSLGLLVCALPWARRNGLEGGALVEWTRPRMEYFNTNPYLAGLVLGAELHLLERKRDEESFRLQKSLSRSLGALGDPFFWEGARPTVAYLGLSAAFLTGPLGVLAAWLFFLVASFVVRELCFRVGFERGPGVVELLTRPWIHRWLRASRAAAGSSCGIALGLGVATGWGALGAPQALISVVGALLCGFLAARRRWPLQRVLLLATVVLWGILRSTKSL